MLILSHPFGNQNVRNAAQAFYRANALERFYTTVAWPAGSPLETLLPRSLVATLRRREYGMLPADKVSTRPLREACRLLAHALSIRSFTQGDHAPCCLEAVYRDLDDHVAKMADGTVSLSHVYSYDHCALATFETAKKAGAITNLELAGGYWRATLKLFQEETELTPDWSMLLPVFEQRPQHFERKDEEIALADRIFVASRFAASGLAMGNFQDKKVNVIPYGSPTPAEAICPVKKDNRKLKVLFVGSLTQAKGLSYLFGARRLLGRKVTLTVIGNRNHTCLPLDRELDACRYIPSLPHSEVLREMRAHDVLVFPSICDAFGLVILEALSQGIPVIASTNTAGPDILTEGVDGFIVPIRSVDTIAERLESLADDAELLNHMKAAALNTAARYSWERYQTALVQHVL